MVLAGLCSLTSWGEGKEKKDRRRPKQTEGGEKQPFSPWDVFFLQLSQQWKIGKMEETDICRQTNHFPREKRGENV